MKKILFYSEGWGLGGIERFIMNTIESMDLTRYQFDIFCTHDWDSSYDEVIEDFGGHRYTVFPRSKPNLFTRLLASTSAWKRQLKCGSYDAVHINTMNGMGLVYAHIAKSCGVPIRIVHSHNSKYGSSHLPFKRLAHSLGKTLYQSDVTDRIACSIDAGTYLFGKLPFSVIRNGTNTDRFRFDSDIRNQTRKKLNLDDTHFLFGSIGRLTSEKNPLFQIRLLSAMKEKGVPAKLLLIGVGPLKKAIEHTAAELNLSSDVILKDTTTRPEYYLNALDALTMPSFYEGLPMTIIEAFSCGLPCILSDGIPTIGVPLTYEKHISLADAPAWKDTLYNLYRSHDKRLNGSHFVKNAGYSSATTTHILEQLYSRS
jgi:glycosyltransferase involved in cell wall biosynthesis